VAERTFGFKGKDLNLLRRKPFLWVPKEGSNKSVDPKNPTG